MGEYRTGDEGTFRGFYDLHDTAEDALAATFQRLGCVVDKTGFDPHTDGGERVTRQRDRATKTPDLWVEGLPVEVKTTTDADYLGNVAKRKWPKYPVKTWFACFYVDRSGKIHGTGAYRKDRATVTGENDSPYGDTFVEPRPVRPLFELFRAVATERGGRQ